MCDFPWKTTPENQKTCVFSAIPCNGFTTCMKMISFEGRTRQLNLQHLSTSKPWQGRGGFIGKRLFLSVCAHYLSPVHVIAYCLQALTAVAPFKVSRKSKE